MNVPVFLVNTEVCVLMKWTVLSVTVGEDTLERTVKTVCLKTILPFAREVQIMCGDIETHHNFTSNIHRIGGPYVVLCKYYLLNTVFKPLRICHFHLLANFREISNHFEGLIVTTFQRKRVLTSSWCFMIVQST